MYVMYVRIDICYGLQLFAVSGGVPNGSSECGVSAHLW